MHKMQAANTKHERQTITITNTTVFDFTYFSSKQSFLATYQPFSTVSSYSVPISIMIVQFLYRLPGFLVV